MVLTWVGIVFMVVALIAWIVYENRRLIAYALGTAVATTRRTSRSPGSTPDARGSRADMSGKQIEFPPKQTHVKSFEIAMLAISIICVVIVLIIVLGHRHRRRVPPDRLSGAGYTRARDVPERRGRRDRRARRRSRRAPTWPRVAVVAAVLVLAFVVSRSCQDAEIEVTQEEAVAMATEQVDFAPEDTQVRLLRQGIDRHPFWIVSLSIPSADGETYAELAVVRIDAEQRRGRRVPRAEGRAARPRPGALSDAPPRPPAHRLRAPRRVLGGDARARRRGGRGRARRGRAAARLARVRRGAGDGRADGRRRRRRPPVARAPSGGWCARRSRPGARSSASASGCSCSRRRSAPASTRPSARRSGCSRSS